MNSMSLLKNTVEIRAYQKNIAEIASEKNTLVVLPTGMGKTLIAVLVAIKRIEKFPDSKILITAPTRPLNAQHKKTFEQFTEITTEQVNLVTGKINPEERREIYKNSKIVIATPQTIRNDLESGKINLENFSFVTFDEAHRAVKDYAYPYIAKKYMLQSKNPLILALTASPGGTPEKINEIIKNLFIKVVEIRTEIDTDVEKYVKPIEREFVYVDFPEEFKKIKSLLEEVLKDDINWLREKHYIPTYRPPKGMLIALQNKIGARYASTKNYGLIWVMIRSAEAIKIEHAIELLETQGISFLDEYFKKISQSKKHTDKRLLKNQRIVEAMNIIQDLNSKGVEHPKFEKLKDIVISLLKENEKAKIIVFANFRSTVDKIKKLLEKAGISTNILVGQTVKNGSGMSQEKQIETLQRFKNNEFNVLIGTSVSEEGIDVPAVDYAIFYEPIASEIRSIQRRGRIGRQVTGKVIFLITKETRDEAYFFASLRKEKRMKGILYKMKEGNKLDRKRNLVDWVK